MGARTTYKLGEIAECSLGKMLDQKKNKGKPNVYLGNVAVRWGSFNVDSSQIMLFEDDELPKYQALKGDIIMCEGGEPGRCAIWKEDYPICLQKALHRIRVNEKLAYPYYIYYYLTSLVQSGAVEPFFTGSTIKHLPRERLISLEISLPSLEEQKRLADILCALEEKIAINKRINHNLEEQAQALYKSWFVDFEPFKDGQFAESELGLIPADWNVKRIGELPLFIADYVANGSFASLKENVKLYESENYAVFIRNTDLKAGSFPVFVDAHSYNFLSKTKLSGGEIIISNVGDVGSVHFCPVLNRPMTLGNNVIMIKAEERQYNVFLYLCLKYFSGHYSIDGITGGSAMPKFNKTDFKGIKIIIPSPQILSRFDEIASPLYERIEKNKRESEKLSIERDTLLPALMSGQLTC